MMDADRMTAPKPLEVGQRVRVVFRCDARGRTGTVTEIKAVLASHPDAGWSKYRVTFDDATYFYFTRNELEPADA